MQIRRCSGIGEILLKAFVKEAASIRWEQADSIGQNLRRTIMEIEMIQKHERSFEEWDLEGVKSRLQLVLEKWNEEKPDKFKSQEELQDIADQGRNEAFFRATRDPHPPIAPDEVK